MNDTRIQALLREGIAASKAGQPERARQALMQVVELDETNAQAWLWLSVVMDDPTDRVTCLQNVLTLDPDNKHAQVGLARLEQQTSDLASEPSPGPTESDPTPLEAAESTPPPSPEPPSAGSARSEHSPSGQYKRLSPQSPSQQSSTPQSSSESKPEAPKDVFANEYLCSYCAARTRPDDTKCKACGEELWIKIPRREKPSTLYKVILGLLIFYLISDIVTLSSPSIAMSDESTLPLFIPIGCTSIIFLFHLTLLIGLYRRWRPIFYLLLLNSILMLACSGGVIAQGLSFGLQSIFLVPCMGGLALLAIAQFFMALNLGDDFTFDKYRLLLEVDPGIKTGAEFFERGRRYAERKMWAKAAIHFRRATYQLSENLDTHLSLAVAYINLKMYDQAVEPLARAREFNPGNLKVEKLQALLDSQRKVEDSTFS